MLKLKKQMTAKKSLGGIGEMVFATVEKSEVDDSKFKPSMFDDFGQKPEFSWNNDETYKTKVGTFWTLVYYTLLGILIWLTADKFIGMNSPNVNYSYYTEVTTSNHTYSFINNTFPI